MGRSTEFLALCSLGTIRVLGSPVEAGRRYLIAMTDEIRLDPQKTVRGVLRPIR
ncbi:MAG: hypothetical protein P8174_07150 [Gemmatimonadota bacterium]